MLNIWGRRTSLNVQRVMWAVAELGLPYERVDVGGRFGGLDTPEYAKLNPNKLVPAIDDNGFVLWESDAIVRYLVAKHGDGKLFSGGAQGYAACDKWLTWAMTSLYGDINSTGFWQWIRTPAAERNHAAIDAAMLRAGQRLAILDAELASRPFIMGDTLTMADLGAGTLMYRYYTLPLNRPKLANVEAWYQRLTERPAYRDHVMVDYAELKVPGA